jgi:hypothetical protein
LKKGDINTKQVSLPSHRSLKQNLQLRTSLGNNK